MIFQDPMTSLNPVHTIGEQLMEAVQLHNDVDEGARRAACRRAARGGRDPDAPTGAWTTTRTSSPAGCASA